MDTVLSLLKMDLGITHTMRDTYFITLIKSVVKEIKQKGIILNLDNAEDQILLSDYAAWVYRKRQEDLPLAQNIQQRIRNRILKERAMTDDI